MDLIIKSSIVEGKIQTLTLGYITFLLYAKIYWPESITTMLCPSTLKAFSEKLNELNMDNGGIAPMEKFPGTTIDITI